MTRKNILVLVFDRLGADRLRLYGGKIEAPNVTSLAKNGTLYKNYIACAGSTAMNLIGMFTGLYPHETGIRLFDGRDYSPLKDMKENNREDLLLPCLQDMGYDTYFLWAENFQEGEGPPNYGNIYKVKSWDALATKFLSLEHNDSPTKNYDQLKAIIEQAKEPWFIFAFFSPVTSGRFVGLSAKSTKMSCDDFIYDADNLLGMMMDSLGDSATIYFTADHGHTHGEHGEIDYAMPLCRSVTWIPLICSEGGGKEINDYVGNMNLKSIILNERLRENKYVYSFNVFPWQQSWRIAIQKGTWRYIYHSPGWAPRGKEELYDLETDPGERCNLLREKSISHSDYRWKRGKVWREALPRTDWEEIEKVHLELKREAERIWEAVPRQSIDEKIRSYIAMRRGRGRRRFRIWIAGARRIKQRFSRSILARAK